MPIGSEVANGGPASAYHRVAVVIVNWRTPTLVLESVAAVRASVGAAWHIYIVDNASNDNSAMILRDLGEDVTFIQSSINGGWTGGNNLGVRQALTDGFERLLMLNSDAVVTPEMLCVLLNESKRRPLAVLGPIQLSMDEKFYNFAGTILSPDTGVPNHPHTMATSSPEAKAIVELQPTAYVQGSGLFVSRYHFERLGLFDDRFYLNFDDTDFCAKARACGHEVLLVKKARLLHAGSGSIGGGESLLNTYFMTRNSLLFSSIHSTRSQHRANLLRTMMSGLARTRTAGRPRQLWRLLSSREPHLRVYRRAVIDYLVGRFGDCPAIVRRLHIDADLRVR